MLPTEDKDLAAGDDTQKGLLQGKE